MSNTFVHGKSGKVLIGATDFDATQFGLDWEVESEKITHTGAGGAQVVIAGIESFSGTIEFVYDTTNKPTVSPQQMKPGTVATVHLKPDGSDDFSADVLFTKLSWKSGPSAGAVKVVATVESTGAITYPNS